MANRKENTPTQPKEKLQFPFSEKDWANTPASVQEFLFQLVAANAALEKRIEELEKRLNKNPRSSNKPSSSDSPNPKRKNEGRAFGK